MRLTAGFTLKVLLGNKQKSVVLKFLLSPYRHSHLRRLCLKQPACTDTFSPETQTSVSQRRAATRRCIRRRTSALKTNIFIKAWAAWRTSRAARSSSPFTLFSAPAERCRPRRARAAGSQKIVTFPFVRHSVAVLILALRRVWEEQRAKAEDKRSECLLASGAEPAPAFPTTAWWAGPQHKSDSDSQPLTALLHWFGSVRSIQLYIYSYVSVPVFF